MSCCVLFLINRFVNLTYRGLKENFDCCLYADCWCFDAWITIKINPLFEVARSCATLRLSRLINRLKLMMKSSMQAVKLPPIDLRLPAGESTAYAHIPGWPYNSLANSFTQYPFISM